MPTHLLSFLPILWNREDFLFIYFRSLIFSIKNIVFLKSPDYIAFRQISHKKKARMLCTTLNFRWNSFQAYARMMLVSCIA